MFATPAAVLGVWFRGLLAIALLVGGGWLIYEWYDGLPRTARIERPVAVTPETGPTERIEVRNGEPIAIEERSLSWTERIRAFRPAADAATAMLVAGTALLIWSLLGHRLHPQRLWARSGEPVPELPPPADVKRIVRPDGSELYVEIRGPADAPTVVLTHGWGMSREEWSTLQRDWGDRFRTVVWDLPGLGKSKQPKNHDYRLEKLADDLAAVVEATSSGPVILIGHSIGGMIIQTLCKVRPDWIGSRIAKIALVHTTYMNPLHTMPWSGLFVALQKPLVEPLLYLQIGLSPVVWAMNALSYLNGSLHGSTARSGFAGGETRQQLDFVAAYSVQDSPAVLARGSFGMLEYDARPALPTLTIPTLVISGEQDPVTLPDASRTIASTAPGGLLEPLDPAKHYGLLEHHAEFAAKLANFCLGDAAVDPRLAGAVPGLRSPRLGAPSESVK